ncbi:WhiB family transcriptional regulator [Streptomyces sp. NPDC058612]|uniref:WhiB family transcriptional regulator n=1 Tax=Streptomyces sp. NPDC058612 TaxID=3346555 RepID=UPI00365A1F8C
MPLITRHASRPHADTDRTDHWADLAACRNRAPEFASSTGAALAMCAACPVRNPCLAEALKEEGTTTAYYREGIRGGLNEAERAALARPQETAEQPTGGLALARQLVQGKATCDREIAERTGMTKDGVGSLRRRAGLPPVPDPRLYVSPQQRLEARTQPTDDGHLLWVGKPAISINGRSQSGIQLAFLLGYGRPATGTVKAVCGTELCVQWSHLTDQPMRDALANDARGAQR